MLDRSKIKFGSIKFEKHKMLDIANEKDTQANAAEEAAQAALSKSAKVKAAKASTKKRRSEDAMGLLTADIVGTTNEVVMTEDGDGGGETGLSFYLILFNCNVNNNNN